MIYWGGWDLWALNPFISWGTSLKGHIVKAMERKSFKYLQNVEFCIWACWRKAQVQKVGKWNGYKLYLLGFSLFDTLIYLKMGLEWVFSLFWARDVIFSVAWGFTSCGIFPMQYSALGAELSFSLQGMPHQVTPSLQLLSEWWAFFEPQKGCFSKMTMFSHCLKCII